MLNYTMHKELRRWQTNQLSTSELSYFPQCPRDKKSAMSLDHVLNQIFFLY